MSAIALCNQSTAGGGILQPNIDHGVRIGGKLIAVVGTQVASHGTSPHVTAVIQEGSSNIKCGVYRAAREGDYASCGHPIINGAFTAFGNGRASASPVSFGLVTSPQVYASSYTSNVGNQVDWNNNMNSYAVWGSPSNVTGTSYDISRSFFAPAGPSLSTYKIQAQADSSCAIYIDGTFRMTANTFKDGWQEVSGISLTRGYHIIRAVASRVNETYAQTWDSTYPFPWNGFMRNSAVFWHPNNNVTGWGTVKRLWYAPYSGNYVIQYNVDDIMNFYSDGTLRISHSGFSGEPPRGTYYFAQGVRLLQWDVYNGGGPGGYAFTIYDSGGVNALWGAATHLEP
jgi:uncharacterized Zn-binding protein involved in type VI secretion